MDIKTTLQNHNIYIKKVVGDELMVDCLFSSCDSDSTPNEGHLYINSLTGAFDCKKCGTKGGYKELMAFLGETEKTAKSNQYSPYNYSKCEERLTQQDINYLTKQRGLTLETIKNHHIGIANFYKSRWLTIPYFDAQGIYKEAYKLRTTVENYSPKYKVYPIGAKMSLYGLEKVNNNLDYIIVCEGEFDCMLLHQEGLNAVSVGTGAANFKDEWFEELIPFKKVYIWFDNDEAGQKGTESLRTKLSFKLSDKRIFKVPIETQYKDITELYLAGGSVHDAFNAAIEMESFAIPQQEMTIDDLKRILDATIKEDDVNKIVTFLGMLTMYTKDSQLNIMYNAPSSTGKSYIPIEISKLFPVDDLIQLAYASPTAFFHDQGEYIEDKNMIEIDFNGKTIIFLDQPNSILLERLRPILSHDKEEVLIKITDKNLKGGNKTKNVLMKGFPAVIFCTANTNTNEQELTRVLLLSPETTQEKIKYGIRNRILLESDKEAYLEKLEADPQRQELRKRILAIKYSSINHVKINNWHEIYEKFIDSEQVLKPRHQRDSGKLIQLIISLAMLNQWNRKRVDDHTIEASEQDIKQALALWQEISLAQDLEIPPYVLNFLYQVVGPTALEESKNPTCEYIVLGKKRLIKLFRDQYEEVISPKELHNKYMMPLVNAGIFEEIQGYSDGREKDYLLTEFGLEKIYKKQK